MRYEYNPRTGMMEPKKDDSIYFAQSMGGGLRVDDKKNNKTYIIERDGRLTNIAGVNKSVNFYDMRDARIIADRVVRMFGRDHKFADFHMFLKGYHVVENLTSLVDRYKNRGGVREEERKYVYIGDKRYTVDEICNRLIYKVESVWDNNNRRAIITVGYFSDDGYGDALYTLKKHNYGIEGEFNPVDNVVSPEWLVNTFKREYKNHEYLHKDDIVLDANGVIKEFEKIVNEEGDGAKIYPLKIEDVTAFTDCGLYIDMNYKISYD